MTKLEACPESRDLGSDETDTVPNCTLNVSGFRGFSHLTNSCAQDSIIHHAGKQDLL